jgi:hypothetical protein
MTHSYPIVQMLIIKVFCKPFNLEISYKIDLQIFYSLRLLTLIENYIMYEMAVKSKINSF